MSTLEDVITLGVGVDRELDLRWYRYEIAAHAYTEAKRLFEELVRDGDLVLHSPDYQRIRRETVREYRYRKIKARELVLARYDQIRSAK